MFGPPNEQQLIANLEQEYQNIVNDIRGILPSDPNKASADQVRNYTLRSHLMSCYLSPKYYPDAYTLSMFYSAPKLLQRMQEIENELSANVRMGETWYQQLAPGSPPIIYASTPVGSPPASPSPPPNVNVQLTKISND